MEKALKKTGFFFSGIFLMGGFYTAVFRIVLRSQSFAETIVSPDCLAIFFIAGLFFLSAIWSAIKWIQPSIFLLLTPYTLYSDATSFYGLGFYVIAMALLFRLGFFDSHRVIRLTLCFLYFVLSEVTLFAIEKDRLFDALGAIFFVVVFLVFFYLAFQEKLAVYLKEPKLELSLKDKGLAATERAYTLAFASGKTTKEIAFDFGVSESTVRNTLARSYKKLGVEDKAGLSALAERYKLID
jgi:DNA-binding CsgD family transcriptional regulator